MLLLTPLLLALSSLAQPLVNTAEPLGFFTNVASRLLKSELNLDLNSIQVYPTNQYTPAVQRLLQFTANLYDATTNRTFGVADNGFPTVFRPVFATVATNGSPQVFITGFEEVTNANQVLGVTRIHDLSNSNDLPVLPYDMVYGIPVIIGAKKGYPNFNKFESAVAVQVTRKLEFLRKDLNAGNRYPDETNQIYTVAISNTFGIEAWNSYTNDFPATRNLGLFLTVSNSVYLTNEAGLTVGLTNYTLPNPADFTSSQSWPSVGPWPGSWGPNDINFPITFKLPWASARTDVPQGATNWLHLPSSQYVSLDTGNDYFAILTNLADPFLPSLPAARRFHIPGWSLNVRTRIQFAMVDNTDSQNPRIVDYVSLAAVEAPVDVTSNLTLNLNYTSSYAANSPYVPSAAPGALWATNRYNPSNPAAATEAMPTYGIVNQIGASVDPYFAGGNVDWSQVAGAPAPGTDREWAINFFRTNFGRFSPYPNSFAGSLYLTNRFFAPFTPTRTVFFYTSWEANDPLVHYTLTDLVNQRLLRRVTLETNYHVLTLGKLRQLSSRYEPWAGGSGNPNPANPQTAVNLTLKDPLVTRSDDWNFPTNLAADLTALGRVHRGTPWQTVYLKSPSTDRLTWQQWAGVPNPWWDCHTLPTNDWHLASLVISLLTTNNDPHALFSANQADPTAWCGLLNGMTALTNSLSDTQLQQSLSPQFDTLTVQSNSSQAALLATAISTTRSAQGGHYFANPGDVLATPQLSVASPWLNTSSPDQLTYGISDEAYEKIPSQLLPLLRSDSLGTVLPGPGALTLRFTGFDNYAYAVQASANLVDWTTVSTSHPVNGIFTYTDPAPTPTGRFYRSVLLPAAP